MSIPKTLASHQCRVPNPALTPSKYLLKSKQEGTELLRNKSKCRLEDGEDNGGALQTQEEPHTHPPVHPVSEDPHSLFPPQIHTGAARVLAQPSEREPPPHPWLSVCFPPPTFPINKLLGPQLLWGWAKKKKKLWDTALASEYRK